MTKKVSKAQFEKLKNVLTDNGIEADEAEIVAQAVCYVLDVDADYLIEAEG